MLLKISRNRDWAGTCSRQCKSPYNVQTRAGTGRRNRIAYSCTSCITIVKPNNTKKSLRLDRPEFYPARSFRTKLFVRFRFYLSTDFRSCNRRALCFFVFFFFENKQHNNTNHVRTHLIYSYIIASYRTKYGDELLLSAVQVIIHNIAFSGFHYGIF